MNRLEQVIRDRIRAEGPLALSQFMAMALYHPELGYYEQLDHHDPVGRGGDFYTSVSVGPLFGELLAAQFLEWDRASGRATSLWVEAGAHRGDLTADLFLAVQRLAPSETIRFLIREPSELRRSAQLRNFQKRLADFPRWSDQIGWVSDWPTTGVEGVVVSNELLDAFPLDQWRWSTTDEQWHRLLVTMGESGTLEFDWTVSPSSGPTVPSALCAHLPDGFMWEQSVAAETWWSEAAASIRSGRLVTFDYGWTLAERLERGREGSLRGYRQHRKLTGAGLLEAVGEVDLTAQVNWDRIQEAGEQAGLKTQTLIQQERFLTAIAAKRQAGLWSAKELRALQTLTHPSQLGALFKVLVQQRPNLL